MKIKFKSGRGKVCLSIRLDHQVQFGEHVVILGSTKELGTWKKEVCMNWTDSGWVCELELQGGQSIEYKFVIVKKDKSLAWEAGNNRVLKLPKVGSFEMICHWNLTESVDLLPLGLDEDAKEVEGMGSDGTGVSGGIDILEVERSPFVGEWQGRPVSFMQSNEHGNREMKRKWDTTGLQGVALKLVEGDRKARNWWRKVVLVIIVC